MTYKTIFSGQLEFGNERSFERVQQMFEHRAENYYRLVLLVKQEDIFNEENLTLEIPRLITMATEKEWRNTINMLEFIVQYAIAGDLSAWMVEEGKIIGHRHIEPKGDKAAVQAFLRGRELVKESGKEAEAMKALSRAIDKFSRHAKAYERRGFVNYQLHNYKDALYDYSKSIDINPDAAEPFLGRAIVKITLEDYAGAVQDLASAIKGSIPLQPMYWQSRRIKADCHLHLEEYEKAATELKFFTRRAFTPDDPNYRWRKRAFFNYGRALLETGKYADSIKAFDEAMNIDGPADEISEAEQLLYRGMALKKAGKGGFKKDWEEAANRGSKRAAELLEQAAA
ncbi:MAG: tetratricopeptide repeat protein [Lewinellaceae bacterium]|nr:tetratricopeptide repeat protein [Phaeodactylibacter sp.]MCB9038301.1 tetratricopeptide repeat protein [Lewinellaceae bacterium]